MPDTGPNVGQLAPEIDLLDGNDTDGNRGTPALDLLIQDFVMTTARQGTVDEGNDKAKAKGTSQHGIHRLKEEHMLLKPAKDSVDVLIFVSDIRKSLDFYHGTLGLEKEHEVQTPFGTVHRLRYGTSVVKLMDPKQVPPAGPIGLEKQLGIRYLSFVIRDLSRVCTVLREKRVEFTMPETQVLPDTRIAMVKDPDGNIIEFNERG